MVSLLSVLTGCACTRSDLSPHPLPAARTPAPAPARPPPQSPHDLCRCLLSLARVWGKPVAVDRHPRRAPDTNQEGGSAPQERELAERACAFLDKLLGLVAGPEDTSKPQGVWKLRYAL